MVSGSESETLNATALWEKLGSTWLGDVRATSSPHDDASTSPEPHKKATSTATARARPQLN
jgi:hypothetical protein